MAGFTVRSAVAIVVSRGFAIRTVQNVSTPRWSSFSLQVQWRAAHTQPVTANINYITNNKVQLNTDRKTLKLNQDLAKPLCIMMSFMMAKSRHLMKYAGLYLELGYDVVTVNCSPLQLMLPTRGSQVIAADLLKFLEANDEHNPLVVHGFSVGAYVWAELLVKALTDLQRYQPVLDRVAAQVWDSPADVDELPVGLPFALFPNNNLLQKVLSAYVRAHMRVFHKVATQHYLRATHAYHHTPCRAPALFLVSNTDPVGAARRSRHARDLMTAAGIKCRWKCWEESPHVQHYNRHPEEYLAELYAHLSDCGLMQPERVRMASTS